MPKIKLNNQQRNSQPRKPKVIGQQVKGRKVNTSYDKPQTQVINKSEPNKVQTVDLSPEHSDEENGCENGDPKGKPKLHTHSSQEHQSHNADGYPRHKTENRQHPPKVIANPCLHLADHQLQKHFVKVIQLQRHPNHKEYETAVACKGNLTHLIDALFILFADGQGSRRETLYPLTVPDVEEVEPEILVDKTLLSLPRNPDGYLRVPVVHQRNKDDDKAHDIEHRNQDKPVSGQALLRFVEFVDQLVVLPVRVVHGLSSMVFRGLFAYFC